jgi:hypothetical protein
MARPAAQSTLFFFIKIGRMHGRVVALRLVLSFLVRAVPMLGVAFVFCSLATLFVAGVVGSFLSLLVFGA